MQIATWNVNSLAVRLPQVIEWLETNPVDVIGLQELKLADDKFPAQALAEAGWHAVWHGQKTYNGVALLSRVPLQDVVRNNPHFADEQSRLIAATLPLEDWHAARDQRLFSQRSSARQRQVCLQNALAGGATRVAAPRVEPASATGAHGRHEHHHGRARRVDPALEGSIHCTPQERGQLAQIMALGLHDSLRLFTQEPKVYSWWDYRDLAFRRNRGMRIDHLLISEALRPQATACAVDKAPRKNPRPSDHAPVVLTLSQPPAAA